MRLDRELLFHPVMTSENGFSLLETLVAVAVLIVGVGGLAQLFVISARANVRAMSVATASILAQQKLEQLRGLAWGFKRFGLPVSDASSDTSVEPEAPGGGRGLAPSPHDSLERNRPGYRDFLDLSGRLLAETGEGSIPAAFIRRWSIEPASLDPNNTIVIQVLVIPATGENQSARFVSVRARKAW